MQINIRWKDIDKSEAVISHLEEKLAKVSEFIIPDEQIKVEFVHYKKTNNFKSRINIILKTKKLIRAEAEASDILTSINHAVLKLLDQIRREKTKYEK